MFYLLDLLTPRNLQEEEAKFLESETYNPVYKYLWQDDKELRKKLLTSPLNKELTQAVLSEDHQKITLAAQTFFNITFDPAVVTFADEITQGPFEEYSKLASVDTIVEAFKEGVSFFDLDYEVKKVTIPGFFFRPSHRKRTILISAYAQLQFFSIDGAVKHELTHVLRYVNGEYNSIPFSRGYLTTEEGLASFMQDEYGVHGRRSLFQHAAEYSASVIGCSGSLRDIYNFFVELGFSKKLAWQRASRHKFGFTDTSQPGDILKPASYFYYEQKVKALPESEMWKLFVGKITLNDLEKYSTYKGLIPLPKLQEFFEEKTF